MKLLKQKCFWIGILLLLLAVGCAMLSDMNHKTNKTLVKLEKAYNSGNTRAVIKLLPPETREIYAKFGGAPVGDFLNGRVSLLQSDMTVTDDTIKVRAVSISTRRGEIADISSSEFNFVKIGGKEYLDE